MTDNEFEQEFLISEVTEELYLAMQERSMRQADFARLLGKSEAWVSQLFAGTQNLSLRTIADLFAAVDCRLSVKHTEIASGHLPRFIEGYGARWSVDEDGMTDGLQGTDSEITRLAC